MKKRSILYVVVPCYNEQEVILNTSKQLKRKLTKLVSSKKIDSKSRVLYVNDGSKDKTWELIKDISKNDKLFTGICLSKNMGHQNALLAGLMTAKDYADVVISMDADLQDDIDAMDEMLDKYAAGCDIVYGVRSSRKKDTWFKRKTAHLFYRFMRLMGVNIIDNHADYRLASSRVLVDLQDYQEVNLFLRGMFTLIGYDSDVVYYERHERYAGNSKYSLKKMISLALNGITSFTIKPLRIISSLGFLITFMSFLILIYSLVVKFLGDAVSGWTFIVCSIWLVGGIQMLSLGIIGEYIGRIYSETKRRPRYVICENLLKQKKTK